MKIDDVSLTIFAWDGIPATRYHLGALASSTSNLGPAAHPHRRGTGRPRVPGCRDQSRVDGRTAAYPVAEADADGTEPAGARAHPRRHAAGVAHCQLPHDRRGGHGAVGPVRQDRQAAGARADGHVPHFDPCLCEFAGVARHRGLCRSGADVQGERLARLQDPSAARSRPGHQGVRGGAQGGGRRLPADARFHLELRLHRRAARRPCDRGDGLLLVRRSDVGRGHLQLRQAAREAGYPDHGDGVSGRRTGDLSDLADRARHRLSARRYPEQGRSDHHAEDRASRPRRSTSSTRCITRAIR